MDEVIVNITEAPDEVTVNITETPNEVTITVSESITDAEYIKLQHRIKYNFLK
jgi:predicted RNA-binding protein YlqC (UPF0109 family)